MYLAHGGTNFGLTAGANSNTGFKADITSYDYDAPINEQGNATEKYRQLRELIKQYAHWDVPEIPDPLPMIRVDQMELVPIASLYENIESLASEHEEQFYPFESTKLRMFNQGVVVYETQLDANKKYKVNITANDVAFLTIDGKFDQMLDRTQAQHHKNVEIECKSSSPCQLRMLIEAMGHVNFDIIMV